MGSKCSQHIARCEEWKYPGIKEKLEAIKKAENTATVGNLITAFKNGDKETFMKRFMKIFRRDEDEEEASIY